MAFAAIVMMAAQPVGAQSYIHGQEIDLGGDIATSIDGWSIDNGGLAINTWSTEGDKDGTGMTTPFIQRWQSFSEGKLPNNRWTYTFHGLVPNAEYRVTALVRAYNENSSDGTWGIKMYAGGVESGEINTVGSYFQAGNNAGNYATFDVTGQADASGNMSFGLIVPAYSCNWVAMKNIHLYYEGVDGREAFVRINNKSEISSGDKYLIVYQSQERDAVGYALDGNANPAANYNVSISDGVISNVDASHAFTITTSDNYYIVKAIGTNQYLSPYSSGSIFDGTERRLQLTEDNNGFIFARDPNEIVRYLNFNSEKIFQGSTSAKKRLYLYKLSKLPELTFQTASANSVKVDESIATRVSHLGNGQVTYQSSNTSVATVDASGNIHGVSAGEAIITAKVAAWGGFCAQQKTLTVKVLSSDLKQPQIETNPSKLTLAVGSTKVIQVSLNGYDGTVSAVTDNRDKAYVASWNRDQDSYTLAVTGTEPGETVARLSVEKTQKYNGTVIEIPVTVLNLYEYQLEVVNAPATGVSIEIFGAAYSSDAVFTSARSKVGAAEVHVHSLPSYSSQVLVKDRKITVTYSLKIPTAGCFLRVRNYDSNLYASASADGMPLSMGAQGLSNIFYYDEDGHLLCYQNGKFVTATCNMASVANASQADKFTFTRGTGKYSDSFSIKSSTGKYLSGASTTASASTANGSDYAYWYVEILDALPVTVTESGLGYATLYSPVTLDIPGGISAYYVSKKVSSKGQSGNSDVEYKLVLTALVSEIPAKTPVILVGTPGTTYECTLKYGNTAEVPAFTSGILGHCAAQVTSALQGSGTVYALQPNKQEETIGFYPWTKTTTSGFKCYFVSVGGNAPSYRFVFDSEEMQTSLEEVAIEEASEAIYDLCGNRVADSAESLPRGIYIRGGRKIIIR